MFGHDLIDGALLLGAAVEIAQHGDELVAVAVDFAQPAVDRDDRAILIERA